MTAGLDDVLFPPSSHHRRHVGASAPRNICRRPTHHACMSAPTHLSGLSEPTQHAGVHTASHWVCGQSVPVDNSAPTHHTGRVPHCCRQTLPLAKVLFQPQTETSSVSAAKRFRCAEVLLQPGFTGSRVSGLYVTSLQSSMKCDVYIRKELCAIRAVRWHDRVRRRCQTHPARRRCQTPPPAAEPTPLPSPPPTPPLPLLTRCLPLADRAR